MAISQYEKNGQIFWRIYIDLRGRKNPRIRAQKRVNGLKSEREARTEEKRLIRELSEEVAKQESKGATWGEIVEKSSKRGKIFYGCNRYPKCDFASWDKPVAKACPVCGNDYMVEKTTKRNGTQHVCPNRECRHRQPAPEDKRQ